MNQSEENMKKCLLLMTMLLCAMVTFAKSDVKTVMFTTTPQMHCANCENKIKSNLRSEKGVKDIQTNVKNQCVMVTYDASKTNAEKLQKAFKKFGYEAAVIKCDQNGKGACHGSAQSTTKGNAACDGEYKSHDSSSCGGCK